jgi:sugar transferase EpsL
MIKRFFDLFFAVIILFFAFIPMVIMAFIILVAMGRPVLFVQRRPGLYAKPFNLLKFRTMSDERNERGEPLPDEKRLTTVGRVLRRYSLDELPQLFNVVKGDLSFVGPRPLLMEYLPRYSEEQARRHEVRPGITGWAQVNGRNAISWEEKFKLDIWYIDHHNLRLDMKILWLTLFEVFKREGISAYGHVTMPEFLGSQENKGEE